MKLLQIISCLGFQVEASTIEVLNKSGRILQFDMMHELDNAEKEGLMNKTGILYSFSHILIKDAMYDKIQKRNRNLLHKTIGKELLEDDVDDPAIRLLGTDQMNIYCKDEVLNTAECIENIRLNMAAANYAIGESKFEKGKIMSSNG